MGLKMGKGRWGKWTRGGMRAQLPPGSRGNLDFVDKRDTYERGGSERKSCPGKILIGGGGKDGEAGSGASTTIKKEEMRELKGGSEGGADAGES